MKKFYFKKPALVAAAVLALIVVSCGVKIASVVFSSHQIYTDETVTLTTSFNRHEKISLANGIYMFYGVQVPEDWSTAKLLTAKNINYSDTTTTDITTAECDVYSKILQFCFPKDGYKWISYVSTDKQSLTGIGNADENGENEKLIVTEVTLKAGENTGDYNLTIVSGCCQTDYNQFINEDGSINIDKVFGNKIDNSGTDNNETINGSNAWGTNEYLLNCTTMSDNDYQNYRKTLFNTGTKVAHNNVELPIVPKIDNFTTGIDMAIKVVENPNTGIDEVTGNVADVNVEVVDGGIVVEAQDAVATVYDMTGIVLDSKAVNGVANLNARPGMCIVRVVSDKNTTVTKVVVK